MPATLAPVDLAVQRPTRLSVAAVLIRDGRILLLRHGRDAEFQAGTWDLPVQHAPIDAVPEDLLVGALRAQLGIEVGAFHLATVRDALDEPTRQVLRRFVFRVDRFSGAIRVDGTRRWYTEREFADVFQLNPVVAGLALFG